MPQNDRLLRKSVKRDYNINTGNMINNLRVPIYPVAPVANGPGYVYYNSTDEMYYFSVGAGQDWVAIQTGPNETAQAVTTSSPLANTMYQSIVELNIRDILPERASFAGDLLWIAITRDGNGDTNTGVVNVTRVSPIVRIWCNGRY